MREVYRILDKKIFWKGDDSLWAIIIMPDYIKIDNWHGPPHIHINNEKKWISVNNPQKIILKLNSHINRESGVNLSKLLRELR